jgi:hypothetical protein
MSHLETVSPIFLCFFEKDAHRVWPATSASLQTPESSLSVSFALCLARASISVPERARMLVRACICEQEYSAYLQEHAHAENESEHSRGKHHPFGHVLQPDEASLNSQSER